MCCESYITRKNFNISERIKIDEEQLKKDTDWFKHATLVTLPELYEEVQGWRRRFPQFEYSQKWDCIIQKRDN